MTEEAPIPDDAVTVRKVHDDHEVLTFTGLLPEAVFATWAAGCEHGELSPV